MLVSFMELLRARQQQGTAVGAFTCYNFETAMGVLQAAQSLNSSTIILISEKSFAAHQGNSLVVGLRAIAEQAATPVCLQLDHVSDLEQMEAAFKLGVGAIMADGSRLPYAENIQLVRQAVELAHRYGGHIEAELGRIEGNEDIALAANEHMNVDGLTDPEQAAHFVEQTGVACLAVSIGNVHGVYTRPPVLDWARLQDIQSRTPVPLSLHGASGLADQDLRRAIERGIVKINVNTELRSSYFAVVSEQLPLILAGLNLLALQSALINATAQLVNAKIQVYEGG